MDYNKIIKEQEQLIDELISRNRALSEKLLLTEQCIDELKKIIKEFSPNLKSDIFVENKIENIGRYLLSRAREFEDKGATFALLELIKVMVQLRRPLEGALAEYLTSAIDFIFENSKSADAAKKGFLLTGVSSKFGKKRKVGRAVNLLLSQGYKKHKQGDRSAYRKVADELHLSVSIVEKYHNEYMGIRDNVEPEFEKIIEVIKSTREKNQERKKLGLLDHFANKYPEK